MAWSKLDIVNLSFNILNKRTVESFIDSGEFANSAEAAFDVLFSNEISGFSWRFATKIQQLTVDATQTPIIDRWKYVLKFPPDYLSALRTFPRIDFQIYGDDSGQVIYSNHDDVKLEYRYLPKITNLPAYFVNYFSILLAARFANAVTGKPNLAKELAEEVMEARSQALFVDSQSHPTPSMLSRPLLDVRQNGRYWGGVYSGNF